MSPISSCNNLGRRQGGLATLLVALIILISVTLVVIFTTQTAVLEQRMSGNEVRMKQANLAAQAGLEHAMAYMQQSNLPDVLEGGGGDGDNFAYRATFLHVQDPNAADPDQAQNVSGMDLGGIDDVCPADPDDFPALSSVEPYRKIWDGTSEPGPDDTLNNAVVFACGWSDDRSGRSAVMVGMQAGPAIANPPENPLISRGGLDVRGSASVYNAYENLSIRSGGGVNISGAAGSTFLRHRDEPRPADDEPVPEPGDPIYQMQSTKDQLGLGVIDRDDNFGVGKDEFFEHFMGMPKADYKSSMVPSDNVHEGGTIEIDPDSWGQVHWVEGDARIEGQMGNRDNPVVLVVDGDVTARGGFEEFHGILFVMGDMDATGNPEFYGSVVIEGLTEILDENDPNFVAGTPHFIFDPVAAGGGASAGARGMMSGTWRDWSN